MGRRSSSQCGTAAPAAVVVVETDHTAGVAAALLAARTREAAARFGVVAGGVTGGLGERAGDLGEQARETAADLVDRAGPYAERARDAAVELRATAGPAVTAAAVSAAGALDTARGRSTDAWSVLKGDRISSAASARRWPWALAAAVLGAGAGALVVSVLRRVAPGEAPGAQEPHELRAVVDTAEAPAARTPGVRAQPTPPAPVAGPGEL